MILIAYIETEMMNTFFFEYINRQYPNIKYTYELESDSDLPFLDVLVYHDTGTFSTSLPDEPGKSSHIENS